MMEFLPPPQASMNFSVPPPPLQQQSQIQQLPPSMPPHQPHSHQHYPNQPRERHFHGGFSGKSGQQHFRSFNSFGRGPGGAPMSQDDFDGKRLRKSVMRKTVDYNSSIVRALENRLWQRDYRDRRALQPESIYAPEMLPPPSYMDNPTNAVTTRFVKTATNKMRCPIFTLAWTPEGRRLVTGASSGEFTLWNGLTFNFETILQAHDVPVRTMVWSHNDNWMVTGDHAGYVKYWQSNMNNVRMFQAHKEPVRGISFSPTDNKFASCSDDGTLRVWDFLRCQEERVLRGHGADVKCVHWHPHKALIVSGSKDNQQPIKLWDPKSGQALATLHAHKSTVMDLKWNDNGNWLVTASRDHLLKLFDLRNLREEVQVFRGHKKEASAVSWHPTHEGLFSSGGSDGSILFWNVGSDKEVGAIDTAHDSIVWTLAWHPLGHILCSGSNDHTIKFWTRNRPGDQMRDKYNLNTLPAGLQGLEECEIDEHNITIPGMGPEDKIDFTESLTADKGFIPGLDLDTSNLPDNKKDKDKKVPYSKPIPRNFQAQWNDTGAANDDASKEIKEVITQLAENTPGAMPLQKITPTAIIVYGRVVEVTPGSNLEKVIGEGPEALNRFINSGEVEELNDLIPHIDESDSDDENKNDDNDDEDEDGNNDDDNEKDDDEHECKRQKIDRNINHNAQVIYNNVETNPQPAIPSLMAINVQVDVPGVMSNLGNDSDNPWTAPTIFNQNTSNSSQPPSLLNLNVAPPFEDAGGSWQSGRSDYNRNSKDGGGTKRRNRDSDGNRISRFDREGGRSSRFDNNDNSRNRRTGGNSSSNRSSGRSNRRI